MNTLLLIMMGLLLLFLITVSYVIASFGISILFGAPFVATKRKVSQEVFKKAGLKAGQSVADIGCGDGSVLCVAKEAGAGRLVGYEINPILARFARWRLRKEDAEILRVNMFRARLKHTDVVYVYLLPHTVDRLRDQLGTFPPYTKIISRGFPFTGIVPMRSFQVGTNTFYLYRAHDLVAQG